MPIDEKLRKDITAWATRKALDDAKKLGKDMIGAKFSQWLQHEVWHYEKKAYLKIHNRERGNGTDV